MVPEPDLTPDGGQPRAEGPGSTYSSPQQGYAGPPGCPAPAPYGQPQQGYAGPPGYPAPAPYGQPQQGYAAPPGYPQPEGAVSFAPAKPEPLPVEPREYHQFYRAPAFRWWKPLVALAVFVAAVLVEGIFVVGVAIAWEVANGTSLEELASLAGMNTPVMFVANNVVLALCVPAAMLTSWLVFRQRPRWLSSIEGRFRWRLFGRYALIVTPVMLVWLLLEAFLAGGFGELSWGKDSLFLLVAILLTTPFQAAGEEYGARGLILRSVGSWFANRWVALGVGLAVNSVVFMLLHGAGDPWLNAYYLTVAVVFTLLTWRTGGLEAAIVMHIVNNLLGELTLPFSPDELAHMFDRGAGTAGPETLIQIGVTVLVGGLLWWWTARSGVTRATAPAAR